MFSYACGVEIVVGMGLLALWHKAHPRSYQWCTCRFHLLCSRTRMLFGAKAP